MMYYFMSIIVLVNAMSFSLNIGYIILSHARFTSINKDYCNLFYYKKKFSVSLVLNVILCIFNTI